jgi:hypothetical protein
MKSTESELFATQGCVRLEGFHSKAKMAPIKRALLDELKRVQMGRGMPASLRALPVFQQIGKLSGWVKVPGLHASLMTPELKEVIARFGGRTPTDIQETQLLLSPAAQGAWTLQGLNWHVDIAADPRGPIPGVQAFFLIDDVAPQGGATLALAGSHRSDPSGDASGPALRRLLKTSVQLERDLQARGIPLLEMSGRAGDVFLMDMRVLHTPSINATRNVRMMATTRCFLSSQD